MKEDQSRHLKSHSQSQKLERLSQTSLQSSFHGDCLSSSHSLVVKTGADNAYRRQQRENNARAWLRAASTVRQSSGRSLKTQTGSASSFSSATVTPNRNQRVNRNQYGLFIQGCAVVERPTPKSARPRHKNTTTGKGHTPECVFCRSCGDFYYNNNGAGRTTPEVGPRTEEQPSFLKPDHYRYMPMQQEYPYLPVQ